MKKIFIMFMILMGLIFAPLSVDSYEVNPSPIKIGQEGTIKITLKNVQPSGVTTVTKSLEDVRIYYSTAPGIEIKTDNPIIIGTIDG